MKNDNVLKILSSQFRKSACFVKTIFFLIAILFLTTAVSFHASAAITGKVSGVITAEATNEPLANVTVTIVGTSSTATDKRCRLLRHDKYPARRV